MYNNRIVKFRGKREADNLKEENLHDLSEEELELLHILAKERADSLLPDRDENINKN